MKIRQRCASVTVGAAVMLAALFAFAPGASAHATLQSSIPDANATLQVAPTSITLVFSESPDLGLSAISLLDPSGASIAGPRATRGAKATIAILALPKGLANGTYTVSWRVLSAIDGHLTAGSFAFGVGEAPKPGTVVIPKTPAPAAGAVAGRFLLLIGLALLLGASVASILVFRRSFDSWSWSLPACFAIAWAGFGLLVLAQAHRAGVGLGPFLRSSRGGRLKIEGAGLIVLAITAVLAARIRKPAWPRYLLGLAAIDSALLHVLNGHAAAERSSVYATLVQTVHVLAVGAWVGGLVWLIAGLRSEQKDKGIVAHRFARTAGAALALVALTGFLRSLSEVRSWHGLFKTGFGQVVGVKILLFLPLVALGAFNHYRNVPAIRRGSETRLLERFVLGEMFLAAGLFAFTGALAELPPSSSLIGPTKPQQVVLSGSDFATTVKVTLTIAPGGAGPNDFTARVSDFNTGTQFATDRVRLIVESPDHPDLGSSLIELKHHGRAWSARSSAVSIPGTWKISVEIDTPNGAVDVPLSFVVKAVPIAIATATGSGPTIYTATLPGVGQLQVYADPGKPGANEIHETFFNTAGKELAIKRIALRLVDPAGHARVLPPHKLTAGHFSAEARMPSSGKYAFIVRAVSAANQSITVPFTLVI